MANKKKNYHQIDKNKKDPGDNYESLWSTVKFKLIVIAAILLIGVVGFYGVVSLINNNKVSRDMAVGVWEGNNAVGYKVRYELNEDNTLVYAIEDKVIQKGTWYYEDCANVDIVHLVLEADDINDAANKELYIFRDKETDKVVLSYETDSTEFSLKKIK